MRLLALFALLVAGCSQPTVVKKEPVRVAVPVIQKCASEKPAPVTPLNQRFTSSDWEEMSHRQRDHLVAAQALRLMTYAQEMAAATSAC